MPLGTRPSLKNIAQFFGSGDRLSAFRRNGGIVPDIPANAAISTTNAGLKQSQFSGADKVVETVSSGEGWISDFRPQMDPSGVFGRVEFNTNGIVYAASSQQASVSRGNWLTGGNSGNYEIYFAREVGTVPAYFTAATQAKLDKWNPLSTTQIIQTITYTTQVSISAQLRATIRRVGTTTVLATWLVNIDLSNGQPI